MRRGTVETPVFARFSTVAVVGNGGHEARQIAPQTAIWAAANGTNSRGGFVYGFVEIDATPAQLTYRLVRTGGGTMNDGFTITRP